MNLPILGLFLENLYYEKIEFDVRHVFYWYFFLDFYYRNAFNFSNSIFAFELFRRAFVSLSLSLLSCSIALSIVALLPSTFVTYIAYFISGKSIPSISNWTTRSWGQLIFPLGYPTCHLTPSSSSSLPLPSSPRRANSSSIALYQPNIISWYGSSQNLSYA